MNEALKKVLLELQKVVAQNPAALDSAISEAIAAIDADTAAKAAPAKPEATP